MTSERKIIANRLNARKSTGPRTTTGKLRSSRNAVRHGLTAHAIILAPDEIQAYRAFEARLVLDYFPRSTIQRELVERLASLLWRLRRATAIEAGLLTIQRKIVQENLVASPQQNSPASHEHWSWQGDEKRVHSPVSACEDLRSKAAPRISGPLSTTYDVALSFLRLANLDNEIFERLGRYETRLWRQAAQTLLLLEASKSNNAKIPPH